MANISIILGRSGAGKSTSIKTLNPKETVILNVLGKKLPFKKSDSLYNKENKNLFQVEDYTQLVSYINNISEKATEIKTIIIDDAVYIMRKEFFRRAKESGYTKFTEIGQHFQNIIQTAEQARADLNIFFIMHSEEIISDNVIVGYKVATVGKLLDTTYNPIEVVPIVLYSDIRYTEKGKAEFGFYTHRLMNGQVEIPSKTPDEMFTEDWIPNDLQFVVDKMNQYYN